MANSLTALSPTYWSKIMGLKLYKKNIYRSICSFREEAVLTNGQIVDRPYRADIYVGKYTKGSALTAQDISATSDTLTVDQIFAALIYIDDVDKVQNKWNAASVWTDEIVTRLANQMDAAALFKGVYLAADTVDYNDLDGTQTAGAGIVLTISNVLNMFTVTSRKLSVNNVDGANRFFVISPQVKQILLTYLSGRESSLGDSTGQAGNIGRYMGFSLFESNNLTAMIRITPSAAAANGETVVINGITFTFRDTSAAANVSATAADVDDTTATVASNITNMTYVINLDATYNDTAAVGFAPTGAGLAQFQRSWFAVDGTTYIDIYIKGASTIATPTGTCTDWVGTELTYSKQLNLAGEIGAIDFVTQVAPSAKMASTVSAGKDGMNVLVKDLYTVGVFHDMTARLFNVEVDTASF